MPGGLVLAGVIIASKTIPRDSEIIRCDDNRFTGCIFNARSRVNGARRWQSRKKFTRSRFPDAGRIYTSLAGEGKAKRGGARRMKGRASCKKNFSFRTIFATKLSSSTAARGFRMAVVLPQQ